MADPIFSNPSPTFPGCLTQISQVTPTIYKALSTISNAKIDKTDFPVKITKPVSTDILRFDGTNWINASQIPGPFAIGTVEVKSQLFTLEPGASQIGLAVQGAVNQLSNLVNVRDSATHQLFSIDPAGNIVGNANLAISGSTSLKGTLNLLSDLVGLGSASFNGSLSAGNSTLNSLLVTGGTTLHALVAGVSTLASVESTGDGQIDGNLLVIGNSILEGTLSTGPATFNSLTVTGTTLLDGNTTLLGNLVDLGTFSAGASTVNSLTATGTVNVSGFLTGGQASFAATNLHALLLTNTGIGGLKLAQASGGLKRVVINLNSLFQVGTDFSLNGGLDFWLQNLSTGNAVITIDENDKLVLGSTNSTGGAVLGVSGGKVSFYGTSPASQPTITGSTAANVALQNLLSALATAGLIVNSTT